MIKDPRLGLQKEPSAKTKFDNCKEIDLRFLRYHVMGIAGRARGSLLLTFLGRLDDQLIAVNCWIELGNGHRYSRGPKKGSRLPKGHFRVTDDSILYHWMTEMNLKPKNWAQAHIGFKKKCQSVLWRGRVRLDERTNGILEYKTHISVLSSIKASDTWRSANNDVAQWNMEQKLKSIPF